MANQVELERVAKGLECCIAYDYKCNDCPYRDDGRAEDGCYSDELKADALALLKEYDEALKLMVYQYCTMKALTANDEMFHNKYMSAGEAAFRLLGLKNGQSTDGMWERWFPNG